MADRVPASGPWQSDPEILRLLNAYNAAIAPGARGAGQGPRSQGMNEGDALKRYVTTNRQRLGIPDNYTVQTDPKTGEVGLYDPNNNQWKWIGITALVMGTLGTAGALSGGAGATGGGGSTSALTDLSGAPAFGSTDAGVIAGTTIPAAASTVAPAASTGAAGLLHRLATPRGVATTAALIPAIRNLFDGGGDGSNGNSPFGDGSPFMKSAQDSLDMANARTKEAGPIYDALINQAYGQTPTRYRGAAPAGYPAGGDAPPDGAYVFNAPKFGGG